MSENITCVIIDDEPKMCELLSDMLTDLYPEVNIMNTFTSWKPALESLRKNPPDILFTDISMPEKTGFDLLELLPDLSSEIIFVTAHTEFALDAFNFDVCGYILKPVSDTILVKNVDRALTRVRSKKTTSDPQPRNNNLKVGVPDASGIHYINISDIIYCESQNRYTKVVTQDKDILSSYNIGKFHETLDNELFYQLHRSFIINISHVQKYDTSGIVIMKNGKEIPISRKNKDEFLAKFNKIGK